MDRISRVDQVLLLLKKQLAARSDASRTSGTGTAKSGPRSGSSAAGPIDQTLVERLESLRGSGVSDRARLARVLVEELLMFQLGTEMLNDAEFQKAVDDVQAVISSDNELGKLLNELLDQ